MAEGTETKETVLLAWRAPEYHEYSRNWKYYLVLCVLYLAIVGYSVFMRDWFTLVIFTILAAFFLWYIRLKPAERTYRISQLGIYIDNRFYPFQEMHSYWLSLNGPEKTVNIFFAKRYIPQMTLVVRDVEPLKIRELLGKHIPEDTQRTESLMDILMHWFRL